MNTIKSDDGSYNYRNLFLVVLPIVFTFISSYRSNAQQMPDTSYRFSICQAAFEKGKGSVIFIDSAHNNFHTRYGGFFGFTRLLEQDGYQVKSLNVTITDVSVLKGCKIFVIANSLNASNVNEWALPTPSAFSEKEIEVISEWVKNGGNLLLIADHMPFAGAASELGKAFGFEFINGFAITRENFFPPTCFSFKDGTLQDSPVTRGLKDYEKIDSVATFTGSALKGPTGSIGLLRFLGEHYALKPDTAWRFNKNTPTQDLDGYYQGALLQFGKGRVAVFGEAGMFTAQIVNGNFKVGFNSEYAPQNAQFVLNLIHWIDDVKAYKGARLKKQPVSGN